MFTATQAANDGIDANTLGRLSAENLIYRLRRGVYIHAAVAETPHTDLAAAWLAARPAISAPDRFVECDPVAASHESAAYAWGLGDVIPAKHVYLLGPEADLRQRRLVGDIKRTGGLVEEQDLRLLSQRPGKACQLLLATGGSPHRHVCPDARGAARPPHHPFTVPIPPAQP